MRNLLGTICIALITGVLIAPASQAQTNVYTDPVGFISLTAQGTNTGARYSFLSLGLTQIVTNRGLISAVSGTAITLNNTLTAGAFNYTADGYPAFFIEITSGANAGVFDDIISNDTANVYTVTDISSQIAAGQTYKIYPHWTLGNVFGPTNSAGFLGASTAQAADNIQVWNPATQGFITYFYKTSGGGGTGWRSTSSLTANASNAVLYIDSGIVITRKAAGDVSLQLVGGVKLGQTVSPVVSNGYTFAGNVYPAAFTLGGSGLYTTNNATGLNGGTTAQAADNVNIWDPSAQGFTTYFYKTGGGGGTGWRATTSLTTDVGTNALPFGAVFVIQRKLTSSFNWYVPQPFTP